MHDGEKNSRHTDVEQSNDDKTGSEATKSSSKEEDLGGG